MTRFVGRRLTQAFFLGCLTIFGSAYGQVYKCTGADGKLAYQSEPCEGGKALSPAPQSAPSAGDQRFGAAFNKIAECSKLSKDIEDILQYRSSYMTPKDVATIDAFRRDCQSLGFRYPDSRASVEHNKARVQEAMEEYMKPFQRGSPPPRTAESGPDPLAKAGRCADLSRAIETSLHQGSSYEKDGAARIVEFRGDCQQIGYKFPDTRANAEFNRKHFNELLRQRAERR